MFILSKQPVFIQKILISDEQQKHLIFSLPSWNFYDAMELLCWEGAEELGKRRGGGINVKQFVKNWSDHLQKYQEEIFNRCEKNVSYTPSNLVHKCIT